MLCIERKIKLLKELMCGDRMGVDVWYKKKWAKKRKTSGVVREKKKCVGAGNVVVYLLLLSPETFLGFGEETELF